MKQTFSWTSSNLITQILTFILSVFAMAGAAFPGGAEGTASEISQTILSGSGVWAIGAVIVLNLVNPLYHFFVKNKGGNKLLAVLGSPNFFISLFSLLSGIAIVAGIGIPDGTGEAVIGAIFAKDWSALAILIFSNILSPIVRYFRNKRIPADG